jgi:uncharacterized membrane protein YhhN
VTLLLGCVVALFTVLLLVAEARSSQLGKWLTKPIASLAFVLLAWSEGALHSFYGRIVLLGLVLAALGDVLLIPASLAAFRAGIASFLLGHVAFTAAFIVRGVALPYFAGALAVTTALGVLVGRWLWPYGGELRPAIVVYIAVISVMVPAAVGTATHTGAGLIAVGALAFYLSDLSVARDRFVHASFTNRLWGLPLYYLAEVLLAKSTHVP